MKNISAKKISILSVILIAVSAITAAILPSKSIDTKFANSEDNGTLVDNSGGGGTSGVLACIPDLTEGYSCHMTEGSSTGPLSELPLHRTAGNTSNSNPGNSVDTTSFAS